MMTTLLILSFAFVGIFGFILFPILCWKWSASDAPLFAVSLVMALLYIFGLFNAFPFGIYFVFVLSILLTILAFMLTRKEFKQVLIRLFSPSFFLFILSFFILGFLSRSWSLSEWDEYSHWGMFVKAMFYENRLPALVSFSMVQNYYPPVISIFQYYVTRLAGYSEQGVYFAQNIVILAAIIATIKNIAWKRGFLAVGVILFGYLSFYLWGFILNSIYMDGVLGIVFGATLIAYYGDDNRDWNSIFKIMPTLFILPVIKQIGILFALVIVSFVLFDQLFLKNEQKFEIKTVLSKKFGLRFLTNASIVLIPIVSNISWTTFLKVWHVNNFSYTPTLTIINIIKAFSSQATDHQRVVINHFSSVYRDVPIGFFPSGCIGIIIVFIILMMLYILIKPSGTGMSRGIWLQIILLCGFLLYSFTIMNFYVFLSDLYEAAGMGSVPRYLSTYIVGWALAVFALFYLEIKEKLFDGSFNQKFFLIIYTGFILTALNYVPVAKLLTPPNLLDVRKEVQATIKPIAPLMETNSKVYLVYQGTEGFKFHVTRYFIAPRTTNSWNWSLGEPYYNGDIWTVNLTPTEWFNTVQKEKYNYIFVGSADDKFWKKYGILFVGENDDNTTQLFKVESDKFIRIKP